jgi:hypothetical protein
LVADGLGRDVGLGAERDDRKATSVAESSVSVACSDGVSGRPFQRTTTLPPTFFD